MRWMSRRDRGREQRGVCLPGTGVEDRADVLEEAHREHLVALVEHDRARRCERSSERRRMWSRTRPGVPTTAWTPALRRVELRPHRRCRRRSGAPRPGPRRPRRPQLVADLLGELAGRRQHEQLDAGLLGRAPGRSGSASQGDAERAGLAAAGVRLHQHVVAGGAAAGSSRPARAWGGSSPCERSLAAARRAARARRTTRAASAPRGRRGPRPGASVTRRRFGGDRFVAGRFDADRRRSGHRRSAP